MAKYHPPARINLDVLHCLCRAFGSFHGLASDCGHIQHVDDTRQQLDAPAILYFIVLLHRVHLQADVRQLTQRLQVPVDDRGPEEEKENRGTKEQQEREEDHLYP